jgi:hypothetical protein
MYSEGEKYKGRRMGKQEKRGDMTVGLWLRSHAIENRRLGAEACVLFVRGEWA